MPVQDWTKLTITFKGGAQAVINNSDAECSAAAAHIRNGMMLSDPLIRIEIHGWVALPLVVKKEMLLDPHQVACIELQDNPQFLYSIDCERPAPDGTVCGECEVCKLSTVGVDL